MRITQWDGEDRHAFDGCFAVERAAHQADDPAGPPRSARELRTFLSGADTNAVTETWFAAGDQDVLGWYRLYLPDRENLNLAMLGLVVHPGHRCRGTGTMLLRHAAGRAAAHGRSRLAGELLQGGAGAAFAAAAGARAGVAEARRVLDVTRIPPGRIAGLRESAARAAAGYALVTWTGEIPEEYLGGVAYVHEALNDAPWDFEAVRWDAERVREVINRRVRRSGNRYYSVAAVHGTTGQMAALTALSVAPEVPEWGLQNLTAVARPHRGHRLGMLVKTAMLEWLATAEPGMRMIQTGNANANTYMIAINDQLGYELFRPSWQFYTIDVAAIPTR
jgi:GNAT superfamily N-acetyltransferase/RimJ/RimL family protein N-acetyltransferase